MEAPLTMAAPELAFSIEEASAVDYAAVPTLSFGLRIDTDADIRSASLNVQVRIAATKRSYSDHEQGRLVELFGRPEQWGRSLRSLHWTNVALNVPTFSGSTLVDLPVTCTYDLEVTGSSFFEALDDGNVPLEFLFAGTVFYADPDGRLQVRPIAWDKEAAFSLPVATWREMMDKHFANTAWLRLAKGTFDRLHRYRAQNALLTWEDTIDSLLPKAD